MKSLAFFFLGGVLVVASPPAPPGDPLAGISDPQTLSQLLQWSLANQNLDELHDRAEAIRQAAGAPPGVLSAEGNEGDLDSAGDGSGGVGTLPLPSAGVPRVPVQPLTPERRAELQALASDLMPDVVGLMRVALAIAVNESAAIDEREAALVDLEDHACDLDHAHDLMNLGGFEPLVSLLATEQPELQAGAAWVIGSAIKNHHELQLHLLAIPHSLPSLLSLVSTHAVTTVRTKALYALSALLGNCAEAQAAFIDAGGATTLLHVLRRERQAAQPKLVRKSLALATDLLRELKRRAEMAPTKRGHGGGAASAAPEGGSGVHDGAGAEGIPLRVSVNGHASADTEAEVVEQPADGSVSHEAAVEASSRLHVTWRHAPELCEAVLDCFTQEDLDAHEKAVQALEQLMAGDLLAMDAQALASCDVRALKTSLERYAESCRAASNAVRIADGDEEDLDGIGACEDLEPIAAVLSRAIE
eukprot:CAMPEP_0115849688 /NCGR_PEP_ID=MMETSP0287-20121206/11580_1 /TAXON_ID=412157 /ORGANISM="Chrysochromulina rotalis, Strain UIO044" /LENGTH=473 /DNA_ID=CAMNT_0003303667 /DNA_START=15 /DNA_END=1436 /DNA_ORIENTATION=+